MKTLEDLRPYLLPNTQVFGNTSLKIQNLKAMHIAQSGDMTYIQASKVSSLKEILTHSASIIITDFIFKETTKFAYKCIIFSKTPRLQMAKLSRLFDYEKISTKTKTTSSGIIIHPTAYVHPSVLLSPGVVIDPNVTIYGKVTIGENTHISAGTVIGGDGFGYEKDEDGTYFKIAHLGGVVIGNNVEIGANTCIDRGTLGDTIIEDGVKIDNLVHIAHNVHMKKNSVAIAQSMIAGSCIIEEGAWIAPCSAIREGSTIGKDALVGLGSVVVKDVASNTVVKGVPAK